MDDEKRKCKIGSAIAFSTLVAGCVALDIFGPGAESLWILVVLWALFGF